MKHILAIVTLILLTACTKSEETVETENTQKFYAIKSELERATTYIQQNYLTKKNIYIGRFTIIPSEETWQRKNIYYDSTLGDFLIKYDIRAVTCHISMVCTENEYEIFFQIKDESNYRYYLAFHPCEVKTQPFESMNYKVVVLDNHWSLKIEKN
jgi:hypothetical protein